jgi:catabolite regulation protein CreA
LIKIEIRKDPKLKKITVITGVTNKDHQKTIKNLLKVKKPKGHNCVICNRTGEIIVQGAKKVKEIAEVVAKTVGIEIDNIDVPKLYTK